MVAAADPADLQRRLRRAGARARRRRARAAASEPLPKVAALLEEAEEDLLAFYAFPADHWREAALHQPARAASTARSAGAPTSSASSPTTRSLIRLADERSSSSRTTNGSSAAATSQLDSLAAAPRGSRTRATKEVLENSPRPEQPTTMPTSYTTSWDLTSGDSPACCANTGRAFAPWSSDCMPRGIRIPHKGEGSMISPKELQAATHEQRQNVVRAAVEAAPADEKKEVAAAAVDALSPEQRQAVFQTAFEAAPADEQKEVAAAAVDALSSEQRQAVIQTAFEAAPADEKKEVAAAAVDALSSEQRQAVFKTAVEAAPADEKKEVAAAAVDALSSEQRKDLIESMWPQGSGARLGVYMTGFIVAGLVVIGLALVAWGASGGANSIASSLVVLATGFSSAILGGLLGAYIQR